MASYRFELLSKSETASIYFRVSIKRGVSPRAKTGLSINSDDWDAKTKLPKDNTGQNKNLKVDLVELQTAMMKKVNDLREDTEIINGSWLRHQIDLHFGRITEDKQSELITDAIQNVLDTASLRKNGRGGIGLSKSRVNSYTSLMNIFSDYQKAKKSQGFKVKEVNVKFANDFLKYLINDKKYSTSYALKKIADLKTVCVDAETNGIEAHPQLPKINTARPQNETITYLTPSELEQIANANIPNLALQNARKWLLLGCNIGQRGGDLLNITENNFVTRNGYEVIELKQQKTGKNVTIPVLETTKTILETGLPYKISIQKLNDYLKDVCEQAEIDTPTKGGIIEMIEDEKGKKHKRKVYGTYPKHQLVTSHVCRRSFATNNYGILPTPLIMRITSHSTEKTFLGYVGLGSLDYAQQIADFFTLQAQKAKKETQLTIVKKASNE